ncbi:MAG: TrbC/VirB2 family protein [Candidatus Pacebacteria bacterium]|nr:TrbC/VirB2 family protein [Candidatus Paceibacterota bacterium]
MKFILKSFVFIGIFAMVFLNVSSQNAFAATSNTCDAQYTTGNNPGVMFTLINGGNALPANSDIKVIFAGTADLIGGTEQTASYTPGATSSLFQATTVLLSSPNAVHYKFVLNGQQYCPPTGVKSLTVSSTSNPQSCPTGQTWNSTLNQCAPTAQTVGGSQNPGSTTGATSGGNQTGATSGGNQTGATSGGNQTGATSGGEESTENPRLINPLGGVDSIEGFLEKLFNIVLRIAIPIIALAIIYSGFLFVTAQGKEDKLTTAKKTLMYTLIGAAIILGAWLIANALSETVNDIRNDVVVDQNINTNG